MIKKYLLSGTLLLAAPIQAQPLRSAARFILNGLFYVIASSDASEKTTAYAQTLLHHLDPSQELVGVRNFNGIGRYLFGKNNTLALPYLNYVILDEDIDKLPEAEQRFVIGRSLTTLTHKHSYVLSHYVIPYLLFLLYEQQTTAEERDAHRSYTSLLLETPFLLTKALFMRAKAFCGFDGYDDSLQQLTALPRHTKELAYPIGISVLGTLLSRYFIHKNETTLDLATAQQLHCYGGGINYLARASHFAAESYPVVWYFLKTYVLPWYLETYFKRPLMTKFPQLHELETSRSLGDTTYLRPPALEHLPTTFFSLAPGKAFDDGISLPHIALSFLPYASKVFAKFPSYKDRVETLYDEYQKKQ